MGSFLFFYSVPLIYVFAFVPVPYCLDDDSFVIELEVQHCDTTSFGFPFQHFLGDSVFSGSIQILGFLFQLFEKCQWYFNRDYIESVDCSGQHRYFNNVYSSNL